MVTTLGKKYKDVCALEMQSRFFGYSPQNSEWFVPKAGKQLVVEGYDMNTKRFAHLSRVYHHVTMN